MCICLPACLSTLPCPAGTAAVPARRGVPAEGDWRLQPVQEDVVPAQPARQELHHRELPGAALQVGVGAFMRGWVGGGCSRQAFAASLPRIANQNLLLIAYVCIDTESASSQSLNHPQ